MSSRAVASAYNTLVDVDQGVETSLSLVRAGLDRVAIKAQGMHDETLRALNAAEAELREAVESLSALGEKLESDPDRLEANEQRLFALRAAARKYGVAIADLSGWAEKIAEDLRKQDQIAETRQEAIQSCH